MSYSVEVDGDTRIAYIRSWGFLDVEESRRAPASLSVDPDYQPDFGVVLDLRDLIDELRNGELTQVALNLLSGGEQFLYRVGVVVAEPRLVDDGLDAVLAGAGDTPLRLFRALDEAFAWVKPGDRVACA